MLSVPSTGPLPPAPEDDELDAEDDDVLVPDELLTLDEVDELADELEAVELLLDEVPPPPDPPVPLPVVEDEVPPLELDDVVVAEVVVVLVDEAPPCPELVEESEPPEPPCPELVEGPSPASSRSMAA